MSLRLRLLLATAAVALLALVGADLVTYELLQSSLYRQVDKSLQQSHQTLESSISHEPHSDSGAGSSPPSGSAPSSRGAPEESSPASPAVSLTASSNPSSAQCPPFDGEGIDTEGLTPGTVIEVRSKGGGTVYHCATAELGTHETGLPKLPATITGLSTSAMDPDEPATYFTAEAASGREFRVRVSTLADGPAKGGQLIVAVPLADTLDILDTLRNLELVVTGIAVVVVVGLGFWLVRVGLHPLRDVERTAEAIAAGQLTERVPGDQARTEVGRVAHALNVMLERIEGAFAQRDRTEADLRASEERMRQFVADASHELRTPLAAVTAYAELFDRGAAERPEDLERLLRGIQGETSRMRHLVEDLLVLAHLDEGRPLARERTDLVEVAADAVETARTVGPEWPVALASEAPVFAEVDRHRVRQVLDNLLTNVRVHTPAGTQATVTITSDGDEAVIEVADNGPGLSDADARRIFERFFRADPSRSRAHGGAGLGLAIVDSIVRAHGGQVTVARVPSGGARFSVRLPVRAPAPQDTPADHGTPPADRSTPPADPGTPPADPGTPPLDPSTPPLDPGTPPLDPSTPPADRGAGAQGDRPHAAPERFA